MASNVRLRRDVGSPILSEICPTVPKWKSGEVVFSKKLGFLETRSDVNGIIADIRTKVFYGGSVCQAAVPDLSSNWLTTCSHVF